MFAVVLVVHMCALGVKANNCTQHDADQMQANFTKCTGISVLIVQLYTLGVLRMINTRYRQTELLVQIW